MTYHSLGLGQAIIGTVAPISNVNPRVKSNAVKGLQSDLVVLGLLPGTAIDGYFGPHTMTAMNSAASSIGYSGSRATTTAAGLVSVPIVMSTAIRAAAQARVAGGAPAPGALPGGAGPVVLDDGTVLGPPTPGAPNMTTMSPQSAVALQEKAATLKYVLIGGGVLAAIGLVYALSRKKPAATTTANRRGMRRNQSFAEIRAQALRHVQSGHANVHGEEKEALLRKLSRNARGATDLNAAEELALYIENDGDLYRGQTKAIIDNLARKMSKGQYDHNKSFKLWGYLAESGAKKYVKEFGSDTQWHVMFNTSTRKIAAQDLADYYLEEVKGRLSKNALRSNMDPKAALDLAGRAIARGEIDDASDALTNYANWRRNGGFQPPGGDARAEKLRRAIGDRGRHMRSNGKLTTKALAKTLGYRIYSVYSPEKATNVYHVSSPAGYGTEFKSTRLATVRKWLIKHGKAAA